MWAAIAVLVVTALPFLAVGPSGVPTWEAREPEVLEAPVASAPEAFACLGGVSSVEFAWTNVVDPNGSLVNVTVYVYRASDTLLEAVSTGGPATSITLSLPCDATYTFEIRDWFSNGDESPSSEALAFETGSISSVGGSGGGGSPGGIPVGNLGGPTLDWWNIGAAVLLVFAVALLGLVLFGRWARPRRQSGRRRGGKRRGR